MPEKDTSSRRRENQDLSGTTSTSYLKHQPKVYTASEQTNSAIFNITCITNCQYGVKASTGKHAMKHPKYETIGRWKG